MVEFMKKKKFIGLIPVRLNSIRLTRKPLLDLLGLPMFVHVYKRAKFSKLLDDLIVCCDDLRIMKIAKKYDVKCVMTKQIHKNGTERIAEAYKNLNQKYDLIVDIQGDEPLLNPNHIDKVIQYHLLNFSADIILPTLRIKKQDHSSLVKVVKNSKDYVLYLSRSDIPYNYFKQKSFLLKHLSIISFKPISLKKFSNSKKTKLESVENIELLRALEINLKIKSFNLSGDSFSVDTYNDYKNAKNQLKKDKLFKIYS